MLKSESVVEMPDIALAELPVDLLQCLGEYLLAALVGEAEDLTDLFKPCAARMLLDKTFNGRPIWFRFRFHDVPVAQTVSKHPTICPNHDSSR